MKVFEELLSKITIEEHRTRMKEILDCIHNKYPEMIPVIKWNQPMFTDHGTFIIGFSVAKNHISITPEKAGMIEFKDSIQEAGYSQTEMLFRIRWDDTVDYDLIYRMIDFNRTDKAETTAFWR
ncbi:MAG: DUF1801 domain-containing protein [Bacilli bacterium]|nr:DUF1801 domain-containing protein [Bacilli bacterium]